MSNLTKKATYALLADNVYWDVRKGFKQEDIDSPKDFTNSNWTPVPNDWKVLSKYDISGAGDKLLRGENKHDSFTARVFENTKTGEIVISYAGTFDQSVLDWKNNLQMAMGVASKQANQAALLYHQVKEAHPDAQITFTGHSLGGGLASIMGVWFDKPAIVFDPAPFKNVA